MHDIFILSGPNLNNLSRRDPSIYGIISYDQLTASIKQESRNLSINPIIFQTNNESDAIEFIQNNYFCHGAVVNLAGWTHYNYALRDALIDFNKPVIEVHISNIFKREEFRRKSVISDISLGIISGFGLYSYILGIYGINDHLQKEKTY